MQHVIGLVSNATLNPKLPATSYNLIRLEIFQVFVFFFGPKEPLPSADVSLVCLQHVWIVSRNLLTAFEAILGLKL